jgi:hypothetical protein
MLFISHASEDRDFVRPLAEALCQEYDVWYSEYELTLGDSLLQKIDGFIDWLGLPVMQKGMGSIRVHKRFSCESFNAGSNQDKKANQQANLHTHQ